MITPLLTNLDFYLMSLEALRFQGSGMNPVKPTASVSSTKQAQTAFSGTTLPKLDGLDLFGVKGTSALNNTQQDLVALTGKIGTRLNLLG